jgi:hypothetical protein
MLLHSKARSNLENCTVAKVNLSRMDVQALMDLRKQIEETLVSQRTKLEKQVGGVRKFYRLGWS